jgi:WD40 repeat protein
MDATKTHTVHDFKHTRPLISCRFDPSGKYVFAGSEDYKVWRWEASTGKKTELNTDAWVRGLAFADLGKTLISAGYDGRLIWWPAEGDKLEPIRVVEAHNGWARAVAVSPDNSTVASVGNDLVVRLWNVADGKLVREMPGHQSHIYNVAFHPDGKQLATGDLKCNVIEWDVATGKQLRTWLAPSLIKYDKTFLADIGGFRGMTFSLDGKQLLCSGITNVTNAFAGVGNPSVVVFDWAGGKQTIEHLSKGKIKGVAWGVAVHPDGTTIACVGGSGGYLLFWKPDGKEEFHQLKLPSDARDLDLHSDSLHLATAHYDSHLRIHKMAPKS